MRAPQVMLESAPKNRPQRLPTTAPLNVVVYPATNCAADLWPQFQGMSAKLFRIQVDHAARRGTECEEGGRGAACGLVREEGGTFQAVAAVQSA